MQSISGPARPSRLVSEKDEHFIINFQPHCQALAHTWEWGCTLPPKSGMFAIIWECFRWGKHLLIVNTRSQYRIFGANLCQSVPQHCCTFFFSAKRNIGPNSVAAFILASAVCNHTTTLNHRPTPPKTAWLSRGFLLTHVNTDLWPHKVYSTSASAWFIDWSMV